MTTASTTAVVECSPPAVPEPSAERRHFEAHGWILLRGVLDPAQVQRFRSAVDRACSGPYAVDSAPSKRLCYQLVTKESAFVEFITIPRILQTTPTSAAAPPC